MIPLNYHHLYYFYVVAQTGSIAKACDTLLLAQPTVSFQIRALEKALKKTLFTREKQRLVLTDEGRLVLDYAEGIFELGKELQDAVGDRPSRQMIRVQIGIVDQVSKSISQALLLAVLRDRSEVQLSVFQDRLSKILADLKNHTLDLALSNRDVPIEQAGEFVQVNAGTIPIHFVGVPRWARQVSRFPNDLAKIPVLLPTRANPIWSPIEHYLNLHKIAPRLVAEIQDVELLRRMVLEGVGVAPINQWAVEKDLKAGRLVRLNPRPTGIHKTVWLIARKRHRQNPVAEYLLRHFRLKPTL